MVDARHINRKQILYGLRILKCRMGSTAPVDVTRNTSTSRNLLLRATDAWNTRHSFDHAEILDHYRQRDVEQAKEHEINHLEAKLAIIVEAIEKSGPGQVVVVEAQTAG